MRNLFSGLLLLAAALVLGSCGNDPFDAGSLPNSPPLVRVFVPEDQPLNPTSYNQARFAWSATDVDGFVRGFHVAITEKGNPPGPWVFTTRDETTATYRTNAQGQAFPTLYVVAEDDRGALSDTAQVTFPLRNFPPTLQFFEDFTPQRSTFSAASFEFFGFDLDGDDTLLPFAEYRYQGSDPGLVFDIGDTAADPTVGWVRLQRTPTRFSLVLRNIPPADPQVLYVRIEDNVGGVAELSWSWTVNPVRGQILLVDDNTAHPNRDLFYRDALDAFVPGAYSIWDLQDGLPERDGDIRLTLQQFPLLVWYTSNQASANLKRAQNLVVEYLTTDLDPDTPGLQHGRLLLETPQVLGGSNLSSSFRTDVIGVESNLTQPRTGLTYNSAVQGDVGALDILPQDNRLPALQSVGQDYGGVSARYSGLFGFVARAGTAELWRFESSTKWDIRECRLGCAPLLAVRRPDTGRADVVTVGFQLEYANAAGTALDAVRVLVQDILGFGGP